MSIPGAASPLFIGAAAGAAAAYQIDRSLRFNAADSAFLNRTPSSAGNRKTWTISFWVKSPFDGTNAMRPFFTYGSGSGGGYVDMQFTASGVFQMSDWTTFFIQTSSLYRDPSAWYHFVVAVDTTQSTAADRVKLYVNGVEVTKGGSDPSLNYEFGVNNNQQQNIGAGTNSSGAFSAGSNFYLAEYHLVDGQALAPTDFGEYDDNNVWQPKAYSGTYGTNGFHLDFSDNSSNAALGTDSSGNDNDWTVNNLTAESPTTLPAVALDGNDYLSLAYSSDFVLDGDFTIEYFVYWQSGSVMLDFTRSGSYTNSWQLYNQTPTFYGYSSGGNAFMTSSTALSDGWNHIAVTRTISNNTARMFINGVQTASSTSFSHTYGSDTSNVLSVGAQSYSGPSSYFTGKISNLRILNGTALYTANFTVPTTPLTNVTDTVLLCCQSSTSTTTATVAPGTITANGDPTAVSFSDSTAANDSLIDTPTNYTADSGNNGGNYATLNPLISTSATISNGNLDLATSANYQSAFSGFGLSSGNWYFEGTVGTFAGDAMIGVGSSTQINTATFVGNFTDSIGYAGTFGRYWKDGTQSSAWGDTFGAGDTVSCAFDVDSGKIWFAKNGTWQASGDPAAGTNPASTLTTGITYLPGFGSGNTGTWSANFGQRPFAYTPPTGFLPLVSTSLSDPTIADGSTAMDVALYTGNGSTQTISGLAFSPDLVWIKNRAQVDNHKLLDTVRGATKELESNTTDAEATNADGLTAFNSDGFALGADLEYNTSSEAYVAWAWDAGTSTVSNTDGSITSNVRANPSAGFSIVSYTSTNVAGATVGHGLNAVMDFAILKNRDRSQNWLVYHKSLAITSGQAINFNQTSAAYSSQAQFNSTLATNSVFTLGAGGNASYQAGDDMIAYCFAPVSQYSSFGIYTGTSGSNGAFVYTGMRPSFLLIKSTTRVSDWIIIDTARDVDNLSNLSLEPNTSNTEGTNIQKVDILSNGFKLRGTDGDTNANGASYIYAAFAEHPFKTSRAR